MPLIKIDLIRGKTDKELKQLLDVLHQSVVAAFEVPEGDRYQILSQHEKNEMILLDTGLDFTRDPSNQIAITIISKKRTVEAKQRLYQLIGDALETVCQIDSKNILISIVENNDPDWSFGFGEAQFLNGKL